MPPVLSFICSIATLLINTSVCNPRITPDELGQVLNKLDILCPNSVVKKPETNEVDINTDLFTGKVFTEINSFIDSLILDMDVFHQKKRAMLQHSSSSSNNIAGHN
jgi:hypothetical protein